LEIQVQKMTARGQRCYGGGRRGERIRRRVRRRGPF